MSRCKNCGNHIKTRIDFCSYGCAVKHFKGVVDSEIIKPTVNVLQRDSKIQP